MRPVDKGSAPEITFKKYQDAEPYLEERLGHYCSFCEFNIQHVPEVEHKEAKSEGGEELEWSNLLLSCKYCNTRKGTIVKPEDKDKYIWPDEDDTFHAFSYSSEIPRVNEEYLNTLGDETLNKAKNLFKLIKLDNIPTTPKVKDRRYFARSETRNQAIISRDGWEYAKLTSTKDSYFTQIIMLAKATGFFSVWMEVFKHDEEIKNGLLDAFKGTKKEYF